MLAIFDLGNVLFEVDFDKAIAVWAKEAGVSPERLRDRFSIDDHLMAFERGSISPDAFFAHLGDQLGTAVPLEVLITGWNSIYGDTMPHSYAAMRRLASVMSTVALTNTNVTHCQVWKERYRAELQVFRKVYVSSEMGMRKPERRVFEHVLTEWAVKPASAVFFDDSEENLRGAEAVGMNTVLVDTDSTVEAWVNGLTCPPAALHPRAAVARPSPTQPR